MAFEFGELERPGADRLGAHVAVGDVTGKDRRKSRGQHRQQRWLRLRQMKGDLILTIERDLFQVLIPDLARVAPEVLRLDTIEAMPGALHVLTREGLAVVPGHAAV